MGNKGKGDKITRGEIERLSSKARARLLFILSTTDVEFQSMITLTYGETYPNAGHTVKTHLNRFLSWYRYQKWGEYVWFLEFQQRGAPHIHIYSQVSEISRKHRIGYTNAWIRALSDDLGIDDSEQEKIRSVHNHASQWAKFRSDDGHIRYATKYLLKTYQKKVPNDFRTVGRFYGMSRNVKARSKPSLSLPVKEEHLRELLSSEGHRVAEWDILPKYLFGVEFAKILDAT